MDDLGINIPKTLHQKTPHGKYRKMLFLNFTGERGYFFGMRGGFLKNSRKFFIEGS